MIRWQRITLAAAAANYMREHDAPRFPFLLGAIAGLTVSVPVAAVVWLLAVH